MRLAGEFTLMPLSESWCQYMQGVGLSFKLVDLCKRSCYKKSSSDCFSIIAHADHNGLL